MKWEQVKGKAAACGGPRLVKFRWVALQVSQKALGLFLLNMKYHV